MSLFNLLNTADSLTTTAVDTLATESAAAIPADSTTNIKVLEILQSLEGTNHNQIKELIASMTNELIHFAANVLIAIAIYIVGKWLLKRALSLMDLTFEKRNIEISVRSFLRSLVSIVFYILLILTIIQLLGINTTSLVAMLASAGLAIGMALSGTLQNFAGGIMILFLKPYRVGDFITAQGESGFVKEIMLFTTVLETPDRHTIFVPNSSISSAVIDNASFADTRRVDWSVGITYGDSVADARKVIMEILEADKRIFNDPENPLTMPMVGITELADSSVNLTVRGWVKTSDYWGVFFEVYEQIYETLPKRGISFPFPQLDVHIQK